jgi:hypothetical protein
VRVQTLHGDAIEMGFDTISASVPSFFSSLDASSFLLVLCVFL